MSSMAVDPNPQTVSGTPGVQDAALMAPQPMQMQAGASGLGPVGAPSGQYTDAQYLAAEAVLRQQIGSQYNDILQQLGYTDPATGQFIPGTVSQNAQQQEDVLNQGRQQAILQNTQNAQQNGILFSGQRGTMQAQAELPFVQQIGQLELSTPQQLSTLYGQAGDLVNSYQTQNMQLLADAAARQTSAIDANPVTTPPTPAPAPVAGIPDNSQINQSMDNVSGTPGLFTGGTTQAQTLPYYKGPHGPVAFAGGGEVNRPTPALIGEQGPEAVVPRTGLTPDENDQLTMLRQAAQARMGIDASPMLAPSPPVGIHSFGPPPSGVQLAPIPGINPGGPIIQPPHPIHGPTANVLTAAHHLAMAHQHLQHAAMARIGRFAE